MEIVFKLLDAGTVGGYVRAAVSAVLGAMSGFYVGPLVGLQDPQVQSAVGLVVATLVTGIWSHVAKKFVPPAPPAA